MLELSGRSDGTIIRPLDFINREVPAQAKLMDWLMVSMPEIAHKLKGNAQILIVEDNENNSEIMTDILGAIQVNATVARSAQEALDYCQQFTPVLVLMDIGLPDTDGLALTKMLREQELLAKIPILAVSAHTADVMKNMAHDAGCNDFIEKPFRPHEFIETVQKYLGGNLEMCASH